MIISLRFFLVVSLFYSKHDDCSALYSCGGTCSPATVCLCLCVCVGYQGCVSGMLELSTHSVVQQLANKDEFCCVWQRFSVHYFPLCPARVPDLSSCLSCKDTLSGPDSSSNTHTHTHSSTYVENICSDLSHYHSTQHNYLLTV